IEETRALAWGRLSLTALSTPFTAMLVGLTLLAISRRSAPARVLLHAVWLSALVVALDALIVEPLGVRFLPADRVADGAWMMLLLAAGLGAGVIVTTVRQWMPVTVAALGVIGALVAFSVPGKTLTLWPRAAD